MLLFILGAHLPLNPLREVFWGTLGFAGPAEGFVFLAGLVSGIVYGRLGLRDPSDSMWGKAARRAAVIYGTHMLLMVSMFLYLQATYRFGSERTAAAVDGMPFITEPLLTLGTSALLLYQPGLMNILPMYCIFVLSTPWIVGRMLKGHAVPLLALSAAIWAGAFFGMREALAAPFLGRFPIELSFFNVFSWQLMFVTGVYFGVRRAAGRPPVTNAKAWVPSLLLLACVGFFLIGHGYLLDNDLGEWMRENSGRDNLGPVRLVNFGILAWIVAWTGARWPALLSWPPVALLGRRSLAVFSFHIVVVYALLNLLRYELTSQILVAAAAMASLALPAWIAERARARRRSRQLGVVEP